VRLQRAVAALAGGASLAACVAVLPQGERVRAVQAVRAEATIKAALIEAADVRAAPIRVRYDERGIRLEGFVDSEQERQRALTVARTAAEADEVIDELEVR
jgi:osmotically-inducible protein OsmY